MEHVELLGISVRGQIDRVPLVGVLGHQMQRALFTAAADQQGRPPRRGLGKHVSVRHLIELSVEARWALRPELLDQLQPLLKSVEALLHRRPGKAVSVVLDLD